MNLDGVLLGCNLMAAKQSQLEGGPGGLVINVASVAGLTYGMDRNRFGTKQIIKFGFVNKCSVFPTKYPSTLWLI